MSDFTWSGVAIASGRGIGNKLLRESLEVDEVNEEEKEFVVEVAKELLWLVTRLGFSSNLAGFFSNFFISFSNFRLSSLRFLDASLVFTIVS